MFQVVFILELDKLGEVDKLDKLDKLTELDKLDKQDELDELNELDKLNKLDELDKLVKLDKLDCFLSTSRDGVRRRTVTLQIAPLNCFCTKKIDHFRARAIDHSVLFIVKQACKTGLMRQLC